jgi:hypothetical protein
MAEMNIADLDAALNKVLEFIELLKQNRMALSQVRSAQPDEQSALEQLAALSGLARLIDRAKVVH